jgi:hypothetical protein
MLSAMGRRPSFEHWHREQLRLPDGDLLTWTRIDTPEPARVDAFRSERRGALHPADGLALLRAAGHPDHRQPARLVPSFGDAGGLRLGFLSGVRTSEHGRSVVADARGSSRPRQPRWPPGDASA